VQGNYHPLELLRDICLGPNTNIFYALVKQAKTYIKIRFCLELSNYNNGGCFT
jgi:hypothetical protein